MKKKCLACHKEWVEGEPDDGLISHGTCSDSDYCKNLLELWTLNDVEMSLHDYYKLKQGEKGEQ